VNRSVTVGDRELAFAGPADDGVLDAWQSRFERIELLRISWARISSLSRDSFSSAWREQTIGPLREFVAR